MTSDYEEMGLERGEARWWNAGDLKGNEAFHYKIPMVDMLH